MISWWWLVVEGAVLVLLGAYNRGSTRTVAMMHALANPDDARSELARRFRTSMNSVDQVIEHERRRSQR